MSNTLTIAVSGIIWFFLVTSFEIGSLNLIFNENIHIVAIGISMFIFLLININKFTRKILKLNRKINITLILLIVILLILFSINNKIINFLKYASYLLFFLLVLNGVAYQRMLKFSNMYINIILLIAVMGIFQTMLLSLEGWDNLQYAILSKNESLFWGSPDYIFPYGLSFVKLEEPVDLIFIKFIRLIGFSSEPKFFSMLLLVALGMLFLNSTRLNWKFKIKILTLSFALFLSLSFTTLLVISVTLVLYFLSKFLNLKLLNLIIILIPFVIPLLSFVNIEQILDGYIGERFASFLYSTHGVSEFNINQISLFGLVEGSELHGISTNLLYLSKMGLLFFVTYNYLIYTIVDASTRNFLLLSSSRKFGSLLIISTIIIFNLIFISQAVTLLMVFSFIMLIQYKPDFNIPFLIKA